MQITTMGLVLREVKTGEADRILTILTPQHGVVSAVAKGSQRLKNKLFSATGLFCYSEFTLFSGKSLYIVDDACVKEVFWGVRQKVESMALAMYMAELSMSLSPIEDEAQKILKLLLNCLYFLSENKKEPPVIKVIFEMRTLSLVGYMPKLLGCADCLQYDGGSYFFDAANGRLLCQSCAAKRERLPNLDAAALAALRHICLVADDKLFSFTLAENSLRLLDTAVAQYLVYSLDKPLKTLEFYHSVTS